MHVINRMLRVSLAFTASGWVSLWKKSLCPPKAAMTPPTERRRWNPLLPAFGALLSRLGIRPRHSGGWLVTCSIWRLALGKEDHVRGLGKDGRGAGRGRLLVMLDGVVIEPLTFASLTKSGRSASSFCRTRLALKHQARSALMCFGESHEERE